MTIADQLIALNDCKVAIKSSIEGHGVVVGSAPLEDYAGLIDSIPTLSSLPAVGAVWEGGYFAGVFGFGGNWYAYVIAPPSTGEMGGVAWGASGSLGTNNEDGATNTATLVAATGYAYADFCAGLTLGGHSDWFLPSRGELMACLNQLQQVSPSGAPISLPNAALWSSSEGATSSAWVVNRSASTVTASPRTTTTSYGRAFRKIAL